MQIKILKYFIFFTILLVFSFEKCLASNEYELLDKADSLFSNKKYIKAGQIYDSLFTKQGNFTPRMLLKMAFIHEAMGNYPKALYLLNLYNDSHPNKLIVEKMERIAKENNLIGYEYDDTEYLLLLFYTYYKKIIFLLFALGVIGFFYVLIRRRKSREVLRIRITLLAIYLAAIFYIIHFQPFKKGIVNSKNALLMTGPSAGSKFITRLEEGNRLKILGQNDIWYKVKWEDKEAYLRIKDLEILSH